ncbi:MAG: hypothetical protein JSR46_01495 [Verrucomicrobia bacterium]|nr:hypothetical protein [Verrucomicrobiota bacterium]
MINEKIDCLCSQIHSLDLNNTHSVQSEERRNRSGIFAYTIAGAEQFAGPNSVCCDKNGNIFVSDFDVRLNSIHKISKIAPNGKVSTLAGSTQGNRDGIGTEAQFYFPTDLCIDEQETIYVTSFYKPDNNDYFKSAICRMRKVSLDGVVSTTATVKVKGTMYQMGICVDRQGNLVIADANTDMIRRATANGVVSTTAGSRSGYHDDSATYAKFCIPWAVCMDNQSNILVADYGNNRIRKVSPEGIVSTIAGSQPGYRDGLGSEALFKSPTGICVDNKDNIYVADEGNNKIRKITPTGDVSTVCGSDQDNGWGEIQLNGPRGMCVNRHGNLVIADRGNKRVRIIAFPEMTKFVILCLQNIPNVVLLPEIIKYIANIHFSKIL